MCRGVSRAVSGMMLLVTVFELACASAGEATKFDPEPYKEQIQKLDALVNKQEGAPNDGAAIYTYAVELAGALGKQIDDHAHREIVQNRIMTFGEYFSSQEEQGFQIDLAEAKQFWVKLRGDLFHDADWFQ